MVADPKLTDPNTTAAFALHRFGFGPRAGSIAAIASDPRGALLADLARPQFGSGTRLIPATNLDVVIVLVVREAVLHAPWWRLHRGEWIARLNPRPEWVVLHGSGVPGGVPVHRC